MCETEGGGKTKYVRERWAEGGRRNIHPGRERSASNIMQPTDICHAKHFFKWLMCVCVGGYVHLLISGNTSVAQPFFAMHDLVRTAIPICAPTPAPIALTIKIAARPASVIVVTLLNLEKTARSSLLIPFSFLL